MGVHNDWSAGINVPAAQVAPLAKALREFRAGLDYRDAELNDKELIVRALLDAEGDDERGWSGTNSVDKEMYTDAEEEGLEIHADGSGNLGDSETVERLFAEHGAVGVIEGEAEGSRYRVRLKDGKRREYGGDTVYPDDPDDGPVGRIWSLSVYSNGSITTTLHRTETRAEAILRANYDQEPADYADLPLDALIEALERRDGIAIAVGRHVVS